MTVVERYGIMMMMMMMMIIIIMKTATKMTLEQNKTERKKETTITIFTHNSF